MKYLTSILILLSALILSQNQASAEVFTFQMKNDHPNTLDLQFYGSGNRVWPGNGQVYIMDNDAVQTYRLACRRGEKICFGAWVRNRPNGNYWGVGTRLGNGCSNCCYTCNGGQSEIRRLTP